MKDFPQKQIVIHYLLGICTPREVRQVEHWLKEDERHAQLLQQVANNLDKDAPLSAADKEKIKENIFSEIGLFLKKETKQISCSGKQRYGNHRNVKGAGTLYKITQFWLKAVAILLVMAMAGMGGYHYYNVHKKQVKTVWKQRILPYGQTATLRFSDGTMIKLKGGSTLRYPQVFNQKKREVYLKGEAFFSVVKNKSHPFIVHAGHILKRDLGTSFDIKAYDDEQKVQVTVVEGEVAVSKEHTQSQDAAQQKSIMLKKNQWVTYHKDNDILETGEGDIWNMVAWKDQVLVFDNKTFAEAARMLERWYGVKVAIKDKALKNVVLAGEHEDVSLKKVLDSIRFVLGMDYTIHDDVVTIEASHKKISPSKDKQ